MIVVAFFKSVSKVGIRTLDLMENTYLRLVKLATLTSQPYMFSCVCDIYI